MFDVRARQEVSERVGGVQGMARSEVKWTNKEGKKAVAEPAAAPVLSYVS